MVSAHSHRKDDTVRLRHHQLKIDGTTYDFRHTQGSYGHLYEITSTPANLVYADALNSDTPFDVWCTRMIAHLLDVDPLTIPVQTATHIEDRR